MSNIKISEMTEATSLNDSDLLTIVQGGMNKKITKQNAIGDIITAINNPTYTTTEGTDLTINNTRVGNMNIEYYGNTSQTTISGIQLVKADGLSTPTTDTTFWGATPSAEFTPMSDGWGKYYVDNTSGSSPIYINSRISTDGILLETSTQYTIVCEFRNITGNYGVVTLCQSRSDEAFNTNITDKAPTTSMQKYLATTKSSFTSGAAGLRIFAFCPANKVCNFEMRVSVLKGDYTAQSYTYEKYVGRNSFSKPRFPSRNKSCNRRKHNQCSREKLVITAIDINFCWNNTK